MPHDDADGDSYFDNFVRVIVGTDSRRERHGRISLLPQSFIAEFFSAAVLLRGVPRLIYMTAVAAFVCGHAGAMTV